MLLGERNFDFIRMRRRGKVVIGHRASYKQRDKDNLGQEQAQRAKLYHTSRITAATCVVRAMPEASSTPFGNKSL